MGGAGPFPPGPARLAPELRLPVTPGIHELAELRVRDRRLRDRKRPHVHRMRPLLVVVEERCVRFRSEPEGPARNAGVAGTTAGRFPSKTPAQPRRRVAESLPGIDVCLGVHVLVERGELVHEAVPLARRARTESFQAAVLDGFGVADRFLHAEKREVPARVLEDGRRVVQFVGLPQDRGVAVEVAQNEVLVEPRNVPDLPPQRIDDGHLGPHQLVVVEADGQCDAAPVSVFHDGGEMIGRNTLGHVGGGVRPCESF